MANKKPGSELMKLSDYAITQDGQDIRQVMEANMGGSQIRAFDFDQVKIPAGGGLVWSIPSIEEGDDESVKEIRGVIIHWVDKRVYWSDPEATGVRPDCTSEDSITGLGEPGGECEPCPLSQWGSGKNKGQACKQKRVLFVIREGGLLPIVFSMPPTSINTMRKYFLGLASKGIPYYQVETAFGLQKDRNDAGQDYSIVKPHLSRRMDEGVLKKIGEYIQALKPSMQTVRAQDTNN